MYMIEYAHIGCFIRAISDLKWKHKPEYDISSYQEHYLTKTTSVLASLSRKVHTHIIMCTYIISNNDRLQYDVEGGARVYTYTCSWMYALDASLATCRRLEQAHIHTWSNLSRGGEAVATYMYMHINEYNYTGNQTWDSD